MNRSTIPTRLSLAAAAALMLATALPAEAGRLATAHRNAEGGVTAARGAARAGDAGEMARGRRIVTDGQGNAAVTSGAAVDGAQGGRFRRAGRTTRAADGSVRHDSGMTASNAKGSVESAGHLDRDADGQVTQNRTTTATSAATGNSVQRDTSYSKDTGVHRTTTCFDAGGAAITCPSK